MRPSTSARNASPLLFSCLIISVVACDRPDADAPMPAASKGLELGTDSYATARSRFRTNLLRHGPSPGTVQRFETPTGARDLVYASEGRRLRSIVSIDPGGGSTHPAILFLHGGFSLGEGHWEMTRAFRDAGFVVLIPALRGENGQEGDFSLFLGEVDDVLAAAETLSALPYVDKGRIFVAGHSVGGTLAMLAAMASPRFRGAISISGSPDQVVYVQGRPELIPFDPKVIEEFRIRSPVAFATSFRCPARLYFGDDELWLPGSTERTVRLARDAGLDVEAIEVPGDHGTAVPEAINRAIRFFRGL